MEKTYPGVITKIAVLKYSRVYDRENSTFAHYGWQCTDLGLFRNNDQPHRNVIPCMLRANSTRIKKMMGLWCSLLLNNSIRNTSFDDPYPFAHRAVIPKNIKAYQTMNFAASASLMWTRYYSVHIFPDLRLSGRPDHGCSGFGESRVFLKQLHIPAWMIKSGEAPVQGNDNKHTRSAKRTRI